MDWITIITTLSALPLGGVFGWLLNRRNQKRISDSEAEQAVNGSFHQQIDHNQAIISTQQQTIRMLETEHMEHVENARQWQVERQQFWDKINDKTKQIRLLTDRADRAEQQLNTINDEKARLLSANAKLKLDNQRLRGIRCHRYDCTDRLPKELVERLRNLPRSERRKTEESEPDPAEEPDPADLIRIEINND